MDLIQDPSCEDAMKIESNHIAESVNLQISEDVFLDIGKAINN